MSIFSRLARRLLSCLVSLWVCALPGPAAPALAQTATSPAESPKLDPDRQKKIWDLEHTTFVIETYFGKPFIKSLTQPDREKLLPWFLEDFKGEVPRTDDRQMRRAGPVLEGKRVPDALREVDSAAYLERLIASWSGISSYRKAGFKVLFIDSPAEAPKRFDATVMLYAIGRDKNDELVEHVSTHHAVFRVDDEERVKQGAPIVAALRVLSEVERTSPGELMEEVTEVTGLAELPLPDNWVLPTQLVRAHRYQFAVEDYDRDGYPDIAVAATNGRSLLLRSINGERFEDVAAAVGLETASGPPREAHQNALAGWIDYDNDGFPDLLLGPHLYHNVSGERFEDVTAVSSLRFDLAPFGIAVADYDADGLLDIYVVNLKGFRESRAGQRPWVADPHGGAKNQLWHNEGGGKFRAITTAANADGGWHQTFAAAVLYYDDDPYPDLYLANDFGENVFLRNRGDGTFADITAASGTNDFSTSMGVAAGDLDNDGTPELYVANMFSKMGRRITAHIRKEDYPEGIYEKILGSLAGNRLYRVGPDGVRFEEYSDEVGVNQVGWAFAPAMVDLDGDGWLDLYATAGYISADRAKPDG